MNGVEPRYCRNFQSVVLQTGQLVRPLANEISLKAGGGLGYESGWCEVRMFDGGRLGHDQDCGIDHGEANETVRAAIPS